jgi:hypothetical protein
MPLCSFFYLSSILLKDICFHCGLMSVIVYVCVFVYICRPSHMNHKLTLVDPLTPCCQVTYKDMFALLCVVVNGSCILIIS